MDRKEDSVTLEVKSRLEDLFGEGDKRTITAGDSKIRADDPLTELKSIILSIDWEITDDVMSRFIDKTTGLKNNFKDDRILVLFLQILASLGKYIKSNKGKSHPSAFKLLNSAFRCLEKILLSDNVKENEKKRLLLIEVNRFKELREKVSLASGGGRKPSPTRVGPVRQAAARSEAPAQGGELPMRVGEGLDTLKKKIDQTVQTAAEQTDRDEMVIQAIHDLKRFVSEEITQLRAEFDELKRRLMK